MYGLDPQVIADARTKCAELEAVHTHALLLHPDAPEWVTESLKRMGPSTMLELAAETGYSLAVTSRALLYLKRKGRVYFYYEDGISSRGGSKPRWELT